MGNKHSSHSRESHSRKTLNENSHNNTQTSLAGEGSNGHNVSNVELDNIAKVFKSLKKQVDGVDIIPEETFQIYIGLPKELNLPHILYEPFCKLPNILKGIPAKATSGLTYDCFQTSTAFYCEQHKDFLAGRKERIVMFFDSLAEPVSEGEETKVSLGHIYDVLAGTFWVMKTYFANQIQDALSGDETHQPVTVPTHEPAIDLVVAQLAIYQRKAQRDDKNFSAFSSNEIISRSVFEHFVERNIPMFLVVWRAYIYAKFYLGEPDGPRVGRHIFGGRDILPNYDFSSEILKLGDACMLSCFLPSSVTQGISWNTLYIGSEHGYSMNRLETRVFKYPGPTILVAKVFVTKAEGTSKGNISEGSEMILGAYVNEPWRFSKQFWGSNDCKLFELAPQFEVFPSNGRTESHVYCHSSQGIGFGGKPGQFQLCFDNTFQTGKFVNDPLLNNITYTMSHSRPDFQIEFDVIEIEVIGLGGEQAKRQQSREWKFEANEANRRGNVNLANKNQSRQILEMAGILDTSAGELEMMRGQSEDKEQV